MTNRIYELKSKARKIVSAQTTPTLVESFEMTDGLTGTAETAEVTTTRGWIMDELETRNPDAFSAWMDSNEASPRRFFLQAPGQDRKITVGEYIDLAKAGRLPAKVFIPTAWGEQEVTSIRWPDTDPWIVCGKENGGFGLSYCVHYGTTLIVRA